MGGGIVLGIIEIEAPYNIDLAFRRLASNPLMSLDINKRVINLPLLHAESPNVVKVRASGTTDCPIFELEDWVMDEPILLDKLKASLMWESKLSTVTDHFMDTELGPVFKKFYGLPLICEPDLYRCLLTQIIHQQLNMNFAYRLTESFVTTYGFKKEGAWFFPTPERVAGLNVEELRTLKFSERKAEYIIGISKAILNGDLDLERLPMLTDEEVVESLTKLRGVGVWTAQCVLLFGLGRPDVFLPADIGIQNGIKKLYGLTCKPTYDLMMSLSDQWRPYRSYASLYLWENLVVD